MNEAADRIASTADVVTLLERITEEVDGLAPALLPAVIAAGAGLVARAASRLSPSGRTVVPVGAPNSVPPAPVLADLPLITKGPFKGERRMTKPQFAGWCGVTVPTVSDWIYTGRITVTKRGDQKQSRVIIASGERERLRPPVVDRSRKGEAA